MVQSAKIFIAAMLFAYGVGNIVNAASFDCKKAQTDTEVTICSDLKLATLDVALGIAFRDISATNFGKDLIRAISEQKSWLEGRDGCQSNVKCLTDKYNSRLESLSGANYNNYYEVFSGDFQVATLNPSLITLIGEILYDKDLQAINTMIYHGINGPTIKSVILFRDRSEIPFYRCGMIFCNSNPAYLAVIEGNLEEEFNSNFVTLIEVDDVAEDSANIHVHQALDSIEVTAYWLRNKSSTTLQLTEHGEIRPIKKVTGGVSSPGAGTMEWETYLFEQGVYMKEFGYVFADMIALSPRSIWEKGSENPCKLDSFEVCEERYIYDLGVMLYSNTDTIVQSLDVFSYLIDINYPPAKRAYKIASDAISEINSR